MGKYCCYTNDTNDELVDQTAFNTIYTNDKRPIWLTDTFKLFEFNVARLTS